MTVIVSDNGYEVSFSQKSDEVSDLSMLLQEYAKPFQNEQDRRLREELARRREVSQILRVDYDNFFQEIRDQIRKALKENRNSIKLFLPRESPLNSNRLFNSNIHLPDGSRIENPLLADIEEFEKNCMTFRSEYVDMDQEWTISWIFAYSRAYHLIGEQS